MPQDKLTAVRIKQENGEYGPQIPVAAKAENVEYNKEYSVKEVLGDININKGPLQDQINELPTQIAAEAINDWMDEHITPQTQVVIDSSLSAEGAAADAEAAGGLRKMIIVNNETPPSNETKLRLNTSNDIVNIALMDDLNTRINRPIKNGQYDNGEQGQLLRTNGDGSTEWADVGLPTDEQTAEAVSDWLDNHPEATTTVQDGSLTEAKFSDTLKLETIKDYVTPEMFGAKGDGTTDDSDSVINALKYSKQNGVPVYFAKKYHVTKTLIDSSYGTSITLKIIGNSIYHSAYRHSTYGVVTGAIVCDEGIDLFSGLTIYGYMKQITVVTTVTTDANAYTTGSIFKDCTLRGFKMIGCSASRIGSIFVDCDCVGCTRIKDCNFLNINCCAKCTSQHSFVDSVIEGCYINGGSLHNAQNDCFMWTQYNGSTVINNFIDYYRCIYNSLEASASAFASTPMSIGNHYQVFLYLYNPGFNTRGGKYLFGSFSDDIINWTDPNATTIKSKMDGYTRFQYLDTGGTLIDLPENILAIGSRCDIKLNNIKIENNIGNLVFVYLTLAHYHAQSAKLTCDFANTTSNYNNYISKYTDKVQVRTNGIALDGTYKLNVIDVPFITRLSELPAISSPSQYYPGQRIEVNNTLYRLLWDNTQNKYAWKEIYQ